MGDPEESGTGGGREAESLEWSAACKSLVKTRGGPQAQETGMSVERSVGAKARSLTTAPKGVL